MTSPEPCNGNPCDMFLILNDSCNALTERITLFEEHASEVVNVGGVHPKNIPELEEYIAAVKTGNEPGYDELLTTHERLQLRLGACATCPGRQDGLCPVFSAL